VCCTAGLLWPAHLGHRDSFDFDFFSNRPLDLADLESRIPCLTGAKIVQQEKNTLGAVVDRGGPVTLSFFGVPRLPRLASAHTATARAESRKQWIARLRAP
jgi:hypothetical protein